MQNQPKISRTGVYGALVNKQGEILAVKREEGPYAGLWDIPGALLHDGELMLDGLRRGFKESLSLDLKACWQLRTLDEVRKVKVDSGEYIFKHIGVVYQVDADIENQKISSDLEYRWISITTMLIKETSPFLYHATKIYEAVEMVKKQGGNIADFLLKQEFNLFYQS